MKIGLITNLVHIDKFVTNSMNNANATDWMTATGGNTGNVAFVKGIENLLNYKTNIVNWGDNPKSVNQHYDHLVICCANQIGSHVDLTSWKARLSAFDLPTTFIGLGAQSDSVDIMPDIPNGSKEFLTFTKSLRANSNQSNILTRGNFSSEVIEHYGIDSKPFGCPSQFISLEQDLGKKCLKHQQSNKYDRVLTAAGNPFHPSANIEKILTEIVEKYRGDYILQHPKVLIQLALGETNEMTASTINALERVYARIGKFKDIAAWFESYGVFFADALNWMHYSRHFTLAIGPRYHGVALPIQTGVPGKVISIDSRTYELATTTGIPTISYREVETMSADQLVKICRWKEEDASHYDQVRTKNAQDYCDFLKDNGLPNNEKLESLAGQRL